MTQINPKYRGMSTELSYMQINGIQRPCQFHEIHPLVVKCISQSPCSWRSKPDGGFTINIIMKLLYINEITLILACWVLNSCCGFLVLICVARPTIKLVSQCLKHHPTLSCPTMNFMKCMLGSQFGFDLKGC